MPSDRARRICLLAGLAAAALAAGVPAPAMGQEGCTSTGTPAADPGVTPVGGQYRLMSTSSNDLLDIRNSDDGGVTWCPGGTIFPRPPGWVSPGGGIWAPKLYSPGAGVDVVVYSALRAHPRRMRCNKENSHLPNCERRCIGVALRKKEGYAPDPRVCAPGNRISLIDPELFFAAPGGPYLLYKRDPRGRGKSIKIAAIDLNSAKLTRPAVLLRPGVGPGCGRANRLCAWEGNSVEAPTMIKRDGKYYLFYSGGNYRTRQYGVGVAVSEKPTGGFRRLPGNPMIGGEKRTPAGQCGVGHQDVTQVGPDWRIYYHTAPFVDGRCLIDRDPATNMGGRTLAVLPLNDTGRPKVKVAKPAVASPSLPPPGSNCVKHPREASVVCVRKENRVVDVCDRDGDGHRVYARVITDASSPKFLSQFYDENDSRAGCANIPFSSRVASFAVCVQTEGCSAFTSTGGPPPPPAPAPVPPPPAPPPAKDVCAAHPSDPSVVCTRDAGHVVDVCDRDPDGHRAYARVVTEASSPSFLSPYYDGNDSQPGCANVPFSSRVLSVAVCVQYEGCSALKPT